MITSVCFLNYSKGYEWICIKIVSEAGPGPALKDFTFGFNLTQDTLDFFFFFLVKTDPAPYILLV